MGERYSTDADSTLAVVAHLLLNSVAIIGGALCTLDAAEPLESVELSEKLLEMARSETERMASLLSGLVRGQPLDVTL